MFKQYFEYNTDIEDVIIGAILIEKSAFARVKSLVEPQMFYNELNKDLFALIAEMFDNALPIDMLTVIQRCYDKKLNNKHELLGYNVSVKCNNVASSANIEYHSLLIRELYLKRILIEIKSKINLDNDAIKEVEELEKSLTKARQLKADNDWENFKDILMKIRINLENPKEDGIKLGIKDFDDIAGGLQGSELCIIGARPSVGKTAFACQIALNVAKLGYSVGIVSLEMSNTKLSTRILSQISGLEYWKIDRRKFNGQDEISIINDSIENNYHLPIYFTEKTGVTINDIRAKVMKAKHDRKLDIVFIDYLGLIEPEKANNREQEISKISRGLKLLSMELEMPIVVLAQLNRETETNKHKPKLSNLRDSGSIEQDADVVMFIHSDFKAGILEDKNGNSTEHQRDLIVAKYRNGYTKDIQLGWNGEFMKFTQFDDVPVMMLENKKDTNNFEIF